MAQPNSTHGPRLPPVVPTPQLQELYDEYRRAKDALPREQSLESGTPPQGTPMRRSRSTAHLTSSGSRRGDNDGRDHHDDLHPEARHKRATRTGPLDDLKKKKAALVRKLHACPECRGRKVSCDHHDFSLLKAEFDAKNSPAGRASDRRQPPGPIPAIASLTSHGHPQPQKTPLPPQTTQRDLDLRGVFANPANIPTYQPTRAYGAGELDRDILSSPLTSSTRPRLILSSSAPAIPELPPISSAPTTRYVAIGRQLSSATDVWECRWGYDGDGTESVSAFSDEGAECRRHSDSLPQLVRHYRLAHGGFTEPNFMWKCTKCQFINKDHDRACPHCNKSGVEVEWEKWCYGTVATSNPFVSPSEASTQALGFGDSSASARSNHRYSTGLSSFDASCYSPRSASGGSFL